MLKELNRASIVFGSNNEYYYELLPNLSEKLEKIDLIHAFIYPDNEYASEHYSLPVVDKISKRIVINKKTENKRPHKSLKIAQAPKHMYL